MMDAVRQWGMTCCFAALAAGIANMLIPHGSLEKVMRFTVSLFFLCCVLSPLISMKISPVKDISPQSYNSANSGVASALYDEELALAKKNISEKITEYFGREGVKVQSVQVTAHYDADRRLAADSAEVTVAKKDLQAAQAAGKKAAEEFRIKINVKPA
jgi:hypothetical protein